MKVRKLRKSKKFESNALSDYVDMYNQSNLRGKGLSLSQSSAFLKQINYGHFTEITAKDLKDHHRYQRVEKMNERQKKKFRKKREAFKISFIWPSGRDAEFI